MAERGQPPKEYHWPLNGVLTCHCGERLIGQLCGTAPWRYRYYICKALLESRRKSIVSCSRRTNRSAVCCPLWVGLDASPCTNQTLPLNALPRRYHPLFSNQRFETATRNYPDLSEAPRESLGSFTSRVMFRV